MEQSGSFNDKQISRYFEASAAELVRDEFSNKPRSNQLGLGFDTVSFLNWLLESLE